MPARTKKTVPKAAPVAENSPSASGSDVEENFDSAHDEDGASGDESEGSSDSDSDSGRGSRRHHGSESEEGSDSDSLDSSGPRKRRRISPEVEDYGDHNEEDEEEEKPTLQPAISFIAAPSRIKRKAGPDAKGSSQKPAIAPPPPTSDVFGGATTAPTDPNTSFQSLGVHPWLVRSLTNMAIHRPTGIQKGCIPEILKGRDCIGGSRTGSGKTVAFAVPILQKWAEDPSAIFAVVLTPTR